MSILLDTIEIDPQNYEVAYRLLKWGTGIVVGALVTVIGVLWAKLNSTLKDHKLELKDRDDYIKQEGKETSRILNGLSAVLGDLSKGIERDLPRDVREVKNAVDKANQEIKNEITRISNGTQNNI